MEMNINNLKEVTGDVRKVLVYMVNREKPLEWKSVDSIKEELGKDKSYVKDLIKYMYSSRLFQSDNNTFVTLTSSGLQLGQDVADNDIWDEAVKICDEQKVYSLQTVVSTVGRIIQKRICKAIESK